MPKFLILLLSVLVSSASWAEFGNTDGFEASRAGEIPVKVGWWKNNLCVIKLISGEDMVVHLEGDLKEAIKNSPCPEPADLSSVAGAYFDRKNSKFAGNVATTKKIKDKEIKPLKIKPTRGTSIRIGHDYGDDPAETGEYRPYLERKQGW